MKTHLRILNLYQLKMFFLALSIVLCMTACASPPNGGDALPVPSTNPVQEQETAHKPQSISLVSASNGLLFTGIAPEESGFYQILCRPNGTANMLYCDYATAQTIYLSSQLSSTHNSSEDESFIESCIGGIVPGYDGEHVYCFKYGNSELARVYGENGHTKILQMSKTGANRVEMPLPANLAFWDGSAIASDKEHLYVIMVETTSNASKLVLNRIDVPKNEVQPIEVFDSDKTHFIIGAFNRTLLLKSVTRIQAAPFDADYAQQRAQQKHCLYLRDIDSGKKSVITEWTQGKYTQAIDKNIVYLYDAKTSNVEKLDCTTLEKTMLPPLALPEEMQGATVQLEMDVWGQRLFFYLDHNGERSRLVYDVKTGAVTPAKLAFQDAPLNIYAQTENEFLVHTADIETPYDDVAPDGTLFQSKLLYPQYALISKTDFWNNVPNYRIVNTLAGLSLQ